jgi:hypothetical protein
MVEQIYVTLNSGVWAVKDQEGFLGFSPDEGQAVRMGRTVVSWLASHGRPAELVIERSFAPDAEDAANQPA